MDGPWMDELIVSASASIYLPYSVLLGPIGNNGYEYSNEKKL